MIRTLLLACSLLPGPTSPALPGPDAEGTVVRGELGRALDAYLRRLEGLGFSGGALVARGGEVLLSKGYGLADRGAGIPATPATVFPLGSITKHFTAAAVLRLYQQDLLGLEDPIDVYFEDVPDEKRGITIHHLLTHTSGLPGASLTLLGVGDPDAYARSVLATETFFPPGGGHSYSNLGYGLLAVIVERVAGQPFEAYVREALFEPLGMTRTGTWLPEWEDGTLAHGYVDGQDTGTLLDTLGGPRGRVLGSGGFLTTLGDMLRWNRGLDEATVLDAGTIALMTTRHVGGDRFGMGYGCGISVTATGHTMVGHNGSNDVFSADFRRYPDDGVLIFAAGNDADVYAFDVTPDLERIVFGEDVPLPPTVVRLDEARLADFAGSWRFEDGGRATVRAVGDTLVLASGDVGPASLLHPVRHDQVRRRRELLEGLAVAYEAAFEGDLEPLHAMIDPQTPFEDFAEGRARRIEGMLDEAGELEAVATLPGRNRFGEIAVVVVLEQAGGTSMLEYSFGDQEVGSIRGLDELPNRVVRPTGPGRFVAYDPKERQTWSVRFELGEDGTPRALLLVDEGGREHRAERP